MRRLGFYPKLAATGIRKNGNTYGPYLLTCICMIMMRIKKKMNYLTVSEACMQKVRRQITFLRQRQIR